MTARGDTLKAACITVLGSGTIPFASGTWGSLVAIAFFLPLWLGVTLPGGPRWAVEAGLVAGILIASWLSVAWGPWAIERYQRTDPKQFVLDEFAGQWVALLVLPIVLTTDVWAGFWVVGGQFLLFRIFDIIKPPPARQLESLPAGWGVLTDDLFAGFYANLVGQIVWRLTPLAVWLHVNLATAGS